jgi:NodT family efflux transporter outer membrane factor (OMF) lipoprotein
VRPSTVKVGAALAAALATFLVTFLTTTGCAIGPNYARPSVPAPPQFRGASPAAGGGSLADTKWFDLFQDDTLKQLVNTALAQNHDLRIAADRVLEARAQYRIAFAGELPVVNATGSFNAVRGSRIGQNRFVPPGFSLDSSFTDAAFTFSWEADVFGRLRRLTEAARAQYLGTEEARRGVQTTLIADVMSNYFNLRELDLELQIANQTRDNANDGLRLTTLRHNRGVATGLDIKQAEQLLYTATSQIAAIQREIGQSEDALSELLGNNPDGIPRGKTLGELKPPPQIPAGLPSDLLERRPDIREAEDTLIAANANIGAAKALYFPNISLTSTVGAQSRALSKLFTGPARAWSFVTPSVVAPVFEAGAIRAEVHLTETQKQEAIEAYEKAIQNAFREVSDSLIGYRQNVEQRAQEELLVNALQESVRLSQLRYQGGLDSYLQVLDAQRNLFQGQLTLAQLRREELLSVVQLYRALGGGWQ